MKIINKQEILLKLLLVVHSAKEAMTLMSALELLLLLDLDLMARDVLTKLRWLRRLSMMMLCSVITLMTRDATPPMSPTTSPSRRRSARRTSERAVSLNMRRLLSTRLLRSAELLL